MLLWALIFCFLESKDDWAQHYPNYWLDGKNCNHKSYTWFFLDPKYPLFAGFQLEGAYAGNRWIQKRFPDFHHGEWWSKTLLLDIIIEFSAQLSCSWDPATNSKTTNFQFSQKHLHEICSFFYLFKVISSINWFLKKSIKK